MMKKFTTLFIALCMSVSLCVSTFADTWEKDYRTPENHAYHTLVDALNEYKDEHDGKYPDEYLAKWIGNYGLHIALTSDDESVTAWYDDILDSAECEIIYEVYPYSHNQLDMLRNAIKEQFDRSDGMWGCGISTADYLGPLGCVEVCVDPGYGSELESELYSIAESLGFSKDAVFINESYEEIPVSDVEVVLEPTPEPTAEIIYEVQPYSYNQLELLHDAILDMLNTSENKYAISSSGVDLSECKVTVTSSNGYSDELYAELVALAESLGLGADAVYLDDRAIRVSTAMGVAGEDTEEDEEEELAPATSDALTTAAVMAVVSLLGYGIAKKKN